MPSYLKGTLRSKLKYTSHAEKRVKHDQGNLRMTITRFYFKGVAILFVPNGRSQRAFEEQSSESAMHLGRSGTLSAFVTSRFPSRFPSRHPLLVSTR